MARVEFLGLGGWVLFVLLVFVFVVFVVVAAAAVVELSELFCASESSGVRSD